MTKTTSTPSKGGCGCSGKTATKTASPCGCGGGKHECNCGGKCGCADSCSGQEFRRPVFFEGQMLTEDDLQALGNYVVQKNRLHMRHFWGDGVVCGLHVKPHPCSPSKLIVEPGYALDCCGNDIVLQCPQELDVRQMIRDLQIATQGGYDCGDPCPEEKPCGSSAQTGTGTMETPAAPAAIVGALAPVGTVPPATTVNPPPAREYCLYVSYCEKGVDPTTAYGAGQQCGAPACYPTRILEGLRFELRCRPAETPPDNLGTRYCECLKAQWKDANDSGRTGGIKVISAKWAAAIKESQAGTYAVSRTDFDAAVKAAKDAAAAPIADDAALDSALGAMAEMSKQMARYYAVPPDARKALLTKTQLSNGTDVLGKLGDAVAQAKAKELLAARPAIERDYYTALADSAGEIAKLGDDAALPDQDKPLLHGVVLNDNLLTTFNSEVSGVGSRLPLAAMRAASPVATMKPMMAMAMKPAPTIPNSDKVEEAISRADEMVSTIEDRYIECICGNLNPPCLPCEDQGVLLACFAWDQCEIKRLCELVRKFVLTPNNLRYWFPTIGNTGAEIEKFCCCPGEWRDKLSSGETLPLILRELLISVTSTCRRSAYMSDYAGMSGESLYFATANAVSMGAGAAPAEAPENTMVRRALDQLLNDEAFRKTLKERLK